MLGCCHIKILLIRSSCCSCSITSIRDNGLPWLISSVYNRERLRAPPHMHFFVSIMLSWFHEIHFSAIRTLKVAVVIKCFGAWAFRTSLRASLTTALVSFPSFPCLQACIFTQGLMTLPTVPWPLPKASVEYAWVQPHKMLLSALKSVGSPTQQIGRGGVRRKTYWGEGEGERELVWFVFNGGFVSRVSMCACMRPFVHSNVKVLGFWCMQVLLWVSVHIILPEALDGCQATVAGGSATQPGSLVADTSLWFW